MKEPHDLAADLVNGGDVAALTAIADRAGPGQIIRCRQAAMLTSDDVVRLVRLPRVVGDD